MTAAIIRAIARFRLRELLENVDDADRLEDQQHQEHDADDRQRVAAGRQVGHLPGQRAQLGIRERRDTRLDVFRRHTECDELRPNIVTRQCRIDGREIRLREPIVSPDAVIVQDRTLLHQVDVFQGLGEQGYVLINSSHTIDELGLADLAARLPAGHFQLLPATQFAMAQLGRPLPGAAMIAGFAALTELISLAAVQAAYRERFSGKVAEANAEVARLAYEHVSASLKESAHA